MKNRSLTLSQYQCLSEFRFYIRRYLSFNERSARSIGMEPRQQEVLLVLKGLPEGARPRVGFVAERLHIRHHSAVELIKRLTQRGYVRRQRDGRDRREVLLQLTPSGERVLRNLSAEHHDEWHREAAALQRSLKRVLRVCQLARP
jgi:DNA-binding MarR family transcriptional regulator